MKRNIIKALIIALALPAMFVMTSCKEQFDSKELYLYVNTESQPINTVDCSMLVEIRKAGNVTVVTGVDSLKFPVKANRPLPTSATCTVVADPSKVASYNQQNKTNAGLLPSEFLQMSNGGKISIQKGQMVGTDSLKVKLVNLDKLDVSRDTTYVFPLSITSISSEDKGLTISSSMSTIYLVAKVTSAKFTMTMITEAEMTGTPVSGRAIGASNGYSTSVSRLIDGKVIPGWNPQHNLANQNFVIFDLKGERTVTGFRTWPNYESPEENVKNCGIEVSDDKINWVTQGYVELPATTGDASNTIWRYTKFDEPITTKYVRMKILSSYAPTRSGLSEFQFYAQ